MKKPTHTHIQEAVQLFTKSHQVKVLPAAPNEQRVTVDSPLFDWPKEAPFWEYNLYNGASELGNRQYCQLVPKHWLTNQ